MKLSKVKYKQLLNKIGLSVQQAKQKALQVVSVELTRANWEIGRHIIEYEQQGDERAEYGSALLARLSKDLTMQYGKGFGRRNVLDMRRFYLVYKKWQTVSAKLSWSHYIALLSITDNQERIFYEKQCLHESWSVRELQRQIDSALYKRILLSKSKKDLLKSAKEKKQLIRISHPHEIIKDPYILDFLKIPQHYKLTEKVLEQKIIDNLQLFLLEMGKGFAFVSRQFRVTIRNKHYHIDLVFYHRILKCFVLIDLKIKGVKHTDIGQMNWYLNYFKAEENVPGDKQPIGIILTAEKDEVLVEYAMGGITNKIFVSRYKLYLPDKKILQQKVIEVMKSK